MDLVPGRICGECTACCVHLSIDAPELKKALGVPCPHCVEGGGCQIYAKRPSVCHTYYCLWRYLGQLGDAWRPDRSGIMGSFITEVPPGYSGNFAIRLQLIGTHDVIGTPAFVNFVSYTIRQNVALFIVVPGPIGFQSGWALLNENLKDAVHANDFDRIIAGLEAALEYCKSSPKEPLVFEDAPPA